MRRGREATSFSAAPGAERSDTALAPSKGTTSCRIRSSPARRATSLRPIMPAAPITRILLMIALPVGVPQAPPGHVLAPGAGFQIAAVGEIGAHHAVGGIAQVAHAQPV